MAKFCTKCGAPLQEGAKFCTTCGHPVEDVVEPAAKPEVQPVRPSPSPQAPPAQPTSTGSFQSTPTVAASSSQPDAAGNLKELLTGKAKYIAIAVVIVLVAFFAFPSSDISTVKNGHFDFNQTVTVGKAFDKFFSDGKWESKEVNGNTYVYFTGTCSDLQDGSDSVMKISFKVNPKNKSFRVVKVQADGEDLSYVGGTILRQIVAGNKTIRY